MNASTRVIIALRILVIASVAGSSVARCELPGTETQSEGGVSAAPSVSAEEPEFPTRRASASQSVRAFAPISSRNNLMTVSVNRAAIREAAARSQRLNLRTLPLTVNRSVDLIVEPFSVVSPNTQFVVGRKNGTDIPFDYDPASVAMFHGTVDDEPGSHVFLAFGNSESTGYIETGGAVYRLSSKGRSGEQLPPGRMTVFRATRPEGSLPPGVPLCGVAGEPHGDDERLLRPTPKSVQQRTAGPPAPRVGLRHMELAIETDYEYFSLFGDVMAATDYVVAMYGEVSAVYMRDVDTRVEVVFARIWDQPDDLFNVVEPSPLGEFAAYWEANMGAVSRDVAQLFSGRRDYPFGGQAYVSQLCNNLSYGVVGYAVGAFPDPSMPSPRHYDISVTAHELGHNAGTGHTQDNGIDTCHDPNTTPQRGSIMSYCGQTWSGGNANRDHRFHTIIQSNIESYVGSVSCVSLDCNANGVGDGLDIFNGDSLDDNFNGVPDECEDCNSNGVLDPADISGGMPDLNFNGIPDACEHDCNVNGVPDDRDIVLGTSTDAYGNGVPDECEPDCNSNGVSDYTELQANMPLDVDRNTILDACQDCDGDDTTDMDAMGGAHNAWVASGINGTPIREFYATTGVLTDASSGAGSLLGGGQDVIVTSDSRILATDEIGNRVAQYDLDGTYVSDLVASGSGGLSAPAGLIMTPAGTLLVSSRDTNSVLRFNGSTGAAQGVFVSSGSGGLVAPFGLTLGRNGNLYVTSATDEVIEYDGTTGALVGVFVSATENGGLTSPRGLTFKGDGNLLVASYGSNEVLEFDGNTGAPLGKWAQVGTATRLTQVSPWGIRIGPNGNVYVVRTGEDFGSRDGSGSAYDPGESDAVEVPNLGELHLTNAQVYEFDVRNGNFLRAHINGNDHALFFPTGFDFVPGWTVDCNLNLLPDGCDIASGFSLDANLSGVPDECEVDCNNNGNLDRTDIIPFGTSFDCNSNLTPDECDVSAGASIDCNGNGVPDECEPDCNGNGIADGCDVTNGTATDCDGDGILDECDPDCNDNGISDVCDIEAGASQDCNLNRVADECEQDCNTNGDPDDCDLASGASDDCNNNDLPDECELEPTPAPIEILLDATNVFGLTGDCGGGSRYACGSPFGLEWEDAFAGSIASVTIEFNIGVDCNPVSSVHDASLNGGPASTFSTSAEFCSCSSTAGELKTVLPDPAHYVVGGANRLEINTPECLGFIPRSEFGDAYARVTITPVGDEDGSGLPDDCDVDCNNNGISDAIDVRDGTSEDCNENDVPDECDIADGTSLDENTDGIPDECAIVDFFPEPVIDATGPARTNRYLMVEAPVSSAEAGESLQVVRIRIVTLDGFPIPAPNTFYAGPPHSAPDEDVAQPTLTFTVAPLQCAPYAHHWDEAGVVAAYGAEIVPNSTYEIQQAFEICGDLTNEGCWSTPVSITTATYGDVAPPYDGPGAPPQSDFVDIAAMVQKFLGENGAPTKAVAQLEPNVVFPDRPIDFKDIAASVGAFLSEPFAGAHHGPCTCPSTVTCQATACATDNQCAPGLCVESFCADACGRCSP